MSNMPPRELNKWAKEEFLDIIRKGLTELIEGNPEFSFDESAALKKQFSRLEKLLTK